MKFDEIVAILGLLLMVGIVVSGAYFGIYKFDPRECNRNISDAVEVHNQKVNIVQSFLDDKKITKSEFDETIKNIDKDLQDYIKSLEARGC